MDRKSLPRLRLPGARVGARPLIGYWTPRVRIVVLSVIIIFGMVGAYSVYQNSLVQELHLRVVDSADQPVNLARVELNVDRYFTDDAGWLTVSGIRWGHIVDLTVEHSLYLPHRMRVGPAPFSSEVEVVLYRPSSIRGLLQTPDGAPLQGAEIRLEENGHFARSGTDGSFRLENVPAGDHTLRYGLGVAQGSQIVSLPAEANLELVLELSPAQAPVVEEPTPGTTIGVDPTSGPEPSPEPGPTIGPVAPSPGPIVSPSAGVFEYTTVEIEGLIGISNRFGATFADVYRLNPDLIDNIDAVPAGTTVLVPCTPLAAADGYECAPTP